nr:glycosyltransferase [Conexibacter arvalis]
MRILEVAESLGSGVLGVVTPLSQRLAAAGHAVALAYGERPETPPDVEAVVGPGIELFALPWRRRTPREHVAAARMLRQVVDDWRPDVVHLHSSFTGVVGVLSVGDRAPIVYTPHGYSFARSSDARAKRRLYAAIERFVARRATLVGAVSESEAAQARDVARAPRVAVVANGIPALDAPGPAPDRERPRVVAMGRADASRQPDAAGRILARLTDVADVRWIGGGTDSDAGLRALAAHGVPATGWLSHADAAAELAAATALLHWSAWDAQPLAVLEALAADVVVVASDIPANREIVGARQVCSAEEDAVALLRGVLLDPALRERMLERQRERRGRFSADRMARDWEAIYVRLAGAAAADSREETGELVAH